MKKSWTIRQESSRMYLCKPSLNPCHHHTNLSQRRNSFCPLIWLWDNAGRTLENKEGLAWLDELMSEDLGSQRGSRIPSSSACLTVNIVNTVNTVNISQVRHYWSVSNHNKCSNNPVQTPILSLLDSEYAARLASETWPQNFRHVEHVLHCRVICLTPCCRPSSANRASPLRHLGQP